MTAAPPGIDAAAVTAWFAARVDVTAPLRFDPIVGGRSNLTYLVRDAAGRRWVLRRPPLRAVLASAHDVGREHRIMAALADAPVPVPAMVGFEADPGVTGAPFVVMEHMSGHVVRSTDDAAVLDGRARRTAAEDLADVLARLHDVDPDAVGLGDLGRREGYLARQLHRWRSQYDDGGSRRLPALESLHERLAASRPSQQGSAIVHGDYRLDNVVLADDGHVVAVLDWELCTLGDPLADLGLLAVYWDPFGSGQGLPLVPAAGAIDGMGDAGDVLARYSMRSRRDLGALEWYRAFGYWKLAVIVEGVLARTRAGAHGRAEQADVAGLAHLAPALLDRGVAVADDLGI